MKIRVFLIQTRSADESPNDFYQ
ncbi:hypothetical protein, partial [Escherichia coli]